MWAKYEGKISNNVLMADGCFKEGQYLRVLNISTHYCIRTEFGFK